MRKGNAFVIRQAGPGDLVPLTELAYRTFWETYERHNTRENMELHSRRFLTLRAITWDMEEEGASFLVAEVGNDLVGFIHLRVAHTPEGLTGMKVMEVARLYVDQGSRSKGLGKALVRAAEKRSETDGCAALWLGVWEHNDKAIQFYARCGFTRFGQHEYVLGKEHQTDFLHMKKIG